MGHSQYGDWDDAIALAKDFPNVYCELTAAYSAGGAIQKMVDAVSRRLDMPNKHRGRAPPPHLVPGAMHLQPFFARLLPSANGVTDDRIKDFRPSPRECVQAGFPENFQSLPE